VALNDANLIKVGIVRPKNQMDRLIAEMDVRVTSRLDRLRLGYTPVIAEGTITNNSNVGVTYLSLTRAGIMNKLGRVEPISGGALIYVALGETGLLSFQVAKMRA
jgi:hypothetical protein